MCVCLIVSQRNDVCDMFFSFRSLECQGSLKRGLFLGSLVAHHRMWKRSKGPSVAQRSMVLTLKVFVLPWHPPVAPSKVVFRVFLCST